MSLGRRSRPDFSKSETALREAGQRIARLASDWRRLDRHDPRRRDVEAGMTRILDDPSQAVRLALATALAQDRTAPHHIVLALCYDAPSVAAEIASTTPVLIDSELVDLVALSPAAVQCAVALRPQISAALSAAIAAVAEREACLTLLANRDAIIVKSAFCTLLSRFHADPPMLNAIFLRADAPITVRHDIVERALEARHSWADNTRASAVEREKMRSEQDLTTIALAADCPAREVADFVAHLMSRGRLTTALLLRAAASGAFALIEHSLATLSTVSVARVRAIMDEPRAPAFRALCLRAGLPERAFEALLMTAEIRQESNQAEASGETAQARQPGDVIDRVLNRYEHRGGDELDDVLALMRRVSSEMRGRSARETVRRAKPDGRVRSNYLGAQHGFRSLGPGGKVSA